MRKYAELLRKNVNRQLALKGWSQAKLGKRARIPQGNISEYLAGKVVPGLDKIEAIANAFDVTISELFTPTGAPETVEEYEELVKQASDRAAKAAVDELTDDFRERIYRNLSNAAQATKGAIISPQLSINSKYHAELLALIPTLDDTEAEQVLAFAQDIKSTRPANAGVTAGKPKDGQVTKKPRKP